MNKRKTNNNLDMRKGEEKTVKGSKKRRNEKILCLWILFIKRDKTGRKGERRG